MLTEVECGDLKKAVDENDIVMAYFGDKTDEQFQLSYGQLANIKGDVVKFLINSDPECAKEFLIEPKSQVIFRFQQSTPYHGKIDRNEILDWFTLMNSPKLSFLNREKLTTLFKRQIPFLVLFRTEKD